MIGLQLSRDIWKDRSLLLLSKGTFITAPQFELLLRNGIRFLYVYEQEEPKRKKVSVQLTQELHGKILAKHVFVEPFTLLIPEGKTLTTKLIERLLNHKVEEVFIFGNPINDNEYSEAN